MNIIERAKLPTPPFFQKLRNIGIILAAIATAVVSTPVSLPAIIVTIAGYAAVAGSVIAAVSQVTVPNEVTPTPDPSAKEVLPDHSMNDHEPAS